MEGEYLWATVGTDSAALRRQTGWGFFLHEYLYPALFVVLAAIFFVLVLVLALWFVPRCISFIHLRGAVTLARSSLPIKAPGKVLGTRQGDRIATISVETGNAGSFSLPSGIDSYLSWTMVKRLNWSWPLLVQAAREENVPPWCLAFLHYQEPTPHFALTNPRNGEGVFQLHDLVIAGTESFPYTGVQLTKEEFLDQARKAASFLQQKAKEAGNRLQFNMHPFDSAALEAVYSYNGRTYAGINSPSEGLKKRLRELGIPEDKEFARSPYIVGRMTEDEKWMFLRTVGGTTIKFYGYVPLVSKLQQLYGKLEGE